MSADTLLDRSVHKIKMVSLIIGELDNGDDYVLNEIGYCLQQSAELLLKHYLETESTGYPHTHDIGTGWLRLTHLGGVCEVKRRGYTMPCI